MIDIGVFFMCFLSSPNCYQDSDIEKNVSEIIITNAKYLYMPVVEINSKILANDGETIIRLSVRASKNNNIKEFKLYKEKRKLDIISHVKNLEKKFGYIDIGSIRLYEVSGEFCEENCIYRYNIEFGFLSSYNNYLHVIPITYKFPWCKIELEKFDVSKITCFEKRQDGRIEHVVIYR